jgi:hypothetical protein
MNDQDERGIDPLRVVATSNGKVDEDAIQTRRDQYALARVKAVQTRPSTVAAKEFFSNGGTRELESLPGRLDRLAQVLEAWVRVRVPLMALSSLLFAKCIVWPFVQLLE